jgi:hypothetical protein
MLTAGRQILGVCALFGWVNVVKQWEKKTAQDHDHEDDDADL